MRKKIIPVLPYLAIFLAFISYMNYWSEVVLLCPTYCSRGYDDTPYYQDFLGLLAGTWPDSIVFYQSPVPGFFLGLTHLIFQHPVDSLAIPYLIQLFAATLTCALTYKLAKKTFSRFVGLIAVLILGWYVFVKFYATTIEANTLTAFFLTATLFFLYRYKDHNYRYFLVVASVCLGLAALGRSNNLILIGAIAFWLILLRLSRKNLTLNLGIILFTTLIVLSPAIIHSSLAAGRFIPITKTGVYNFTMGNLPDAPGHYTANAVHSLEPSLRFITNQPVDWLLLTLRKFQLFFIFPWTPARLYELPTGFVLAWGVALTLFLFYFFKSFTRYRSLLHLTLILYAGSIILTHIEDEYRVPIFPLLFIFAAVSLLGLGKWFYRLALKRYNQILTYQIQKPALALICSLLILSLLFAYIPNTHLSYKVDSVESEPVYSGILVGQEFQVGCPNLNRVKVKMISANPQNKFITFYLKENSIDGPQLYSQEISTIELSSLKYHTISFPQIEDSAGKSYALYFDTSNLKSAEEGIVFAGGPPPFAESLNRLTQNKSIQGQAFVNSEKLDGNLAISIHCKFHLPDLITTAVSKLAQKTPFPQVTKPIFGVIFLLAGVIFIASLSFIIYKKISLKDTKE